MVLSNRKGGESYVESESVGGLTYESMSFQLITLSDLFLLSLKEQSREMVFWLNETNLGQKEKILSFSHAILLLTEIC